MRICLAKDLFLSQSALTGESEPVEKSARPVKEVGALTDCPNLAFLGGNVISGSATGVVVATGKDTVLVHHRDGRRELCLAADGAAVRELVEAERREEEQRLFYVALTRAKQRLVLPWLRGWPAEKLGCDLDVNRRLGDIMPELQARGLAVLDDGTSFPTAAPTEAAATAPAGAGGQGPASSPARRAWAAATPASACATWAALAS
jgi:hypothetical protein